MRYSYCKIVTPILDAILEMPPFPMASFFFGVRAWLVTVVGQFSIICFRGLGLRIGVRVWVKVRVGLGLELGLVLGIVWCYGQGKFKVRVRIRVRPMVGFGLWL